MSDDRKTLVILSPAFPEDEADTVLLAPKQEFIHSLNRCFPALQVIILAFHLPVLKQRSYTWHGNNVITFNGGLKGRFHSLVRWIKVWRKLLEIKKNHNLTGIFSFWCGECALVGKYFASRYALQHYIWISGQDAKKTNKYVARIKPAPESLVAMSDFLVRQFFQSHGIKPAHVIPIGVNSQAFNNNVPQKRDIDVLGAGSLIPLKQYDVFINVIQQLSYTFPAISAIICGGGPEKANLQQLINSKGLQKNIYLADTQPRPEVLAYMQRSKIFIHTSSYEGFGAVCIEALYAGAHVISFVKPMDEEINHWHIVTSEEEMVSKAMELLQSPNTEYASVKPYAMDNTAKAVMKLFGYSQ